MVTTRFPDLPQDSAYFICEALGGTLPEIDRLEGANYYHDLAKSTWENETKCQSKFWTPLTDIREEAVWRRGTKQNELGKLFWAENEPDGSFYQNCALVYPEGMRDTNCPVTFTCAICVYQFSPVYSIRGTCTTDKRHVYFTSKQKELGSVVFRGFGGYHIKIENNQWVWRERIGQEIIATMLVSTPENYPLGKKYENKISQTSRPLYA